MSDFSFRNPPPELGQNTTWQLGTVQILCDPLRGEGGGHQKITKDHRGGRGGPSKDHVGSQGGGGGHGRPPMHYKRAKENLQLS